MVLVLLFLLLHYNYAHTIALVERLSSVQREREKALATQLRAALGRERTTTEKTSTSCMGSYL